MLLAWPEGIQGEERWYRMNRWETVWSCTASMVGLLSGPLLAVWSLDTVGRKTCLIVWNILLMVYWVVLVTSFSPAGLYVARYFGGVWNGVQETCFPLWLAEVARPSWRAPLIAFTRTCFFLGLSTERMLIAYSEPNMSGSFCALLPILSLTLLWWLPESPYYLISNGRFAQARESVAWSRDTPVEGELIAISTNIERGLFFRADFPGIFSSPNARRAFFVVLAATAVEVTCGIPLVMTFAMVEMPSSALLNATWILSSLFGVLMVHYLGILPSYRISSVATLISLVFLTVALASVSHQRVLFSFYFTYVLCPTVGLAVVPHILRAELFPPQIKSRASATTVFIGYFLTAIVIMNYKPFLFATGTYANFIICTLSAISSVLFGYMVLFETHGMTLEEIQTKIDSLINPILIENP
jgi:MFS family permease